MDESKPALGCCRLLIMGTYDERLEQLTQSDIIARLEGSGGLLAISSRELFYLDSNTHQSAPLALIKRITVNKQTSTVDVMSEQGTLMTIAPAAFQKDELKLFLESLKGHVLRAKSEAAQVNEPPKTLESAETPPPPAEVDQQGWPAPFSTLPPQASMQKVQPVTDAAPPPSSPQISIAEPAKTLPDEPSDSIWAYDGSPKPSTTTGVTEPKATPITQAQATHNTATMPPLAPASSRSLGSTQRIISVLLKVSALITAAVTIGYLVVNMGTTSDIWVPLGVVAVGLALALIQWRLSEPY